MKRRLGEGATRSDLSFMSVADEVIQVKRDSVKVGGQAFSPNDVLDDISNPSAKIVVFYGIHPRGDHAPELIVMIDGQALSFSKREFLERFKFKRKADK